jgi:hypothetical protein
MRDLERNSANNTPTDLPETRSDQKQLDIGVPSLETALQSRAEPRLDRHLGNGVRFRFGEHGENNLELYSQVVRVTLPRVELALPRREPQVAPEGVVFTDPDFFLSIGASGSVLFQYEPASPAAETARAARREVPEQPVRVTAEPATTERVSPSPAPAPEAKDKAKSEKFVGRLGEIKVHTTKQGKVVAEVEIAVPDPERPGSSRLVKFAAFGEKAETLQQQYEAGQLVTAVGIPHEIHRRSGDREWTERQYYFVQLPKIR